MDTLHDRLAELADHAPTGGAPPSQLWARGRRTHRIRAVATAATVLIVGAVGIGAGVRLADVSVDRSHPAPVNSIGISLPIKYPVGEELPPLGNTPGPLAAIWLSPRNASGAPEVIGLVAATGTFGTLPIHVLHDDPEGTDEPVVALSADGRRMAYSSPTREMIVHDLVSGENKSPLSEFDTRTGYTWVDATHLVGYVAGGSDADGWVWEPGTAAQLIDLYTYAKGFDLWVSQQGSGPQPWPGDTACSSPILTDNTGEYGEYMPDGGYRLEVPELCDVLGVIDSKMLLGHWNTDRSPGDWNNPEDGNGTVVALDAHGAKSSFEDPALRHVVATAGAPSRVTYATDLIGEALDAAGAS